MRGPEPVYAVGAQLPAIDDLVEEGIRIVEQLSGRRLLQDRGVLALQLPGQEEELPVDELAQPAQVRLEEPRPGERWHRQVVEAEPLPVGLRLPQRQHGPALL